MSTAQTVPPSLILPPLQHVLDARPSGAELTSRTTNLSRQSPLATWQERQPFAARAWNQIATRHVDVHEDWVLARVAHAFNPRRHTVLGSETKLRFAKILISAGLFPRFGKRFASVLGGLPASTPQRSMPQSQSHSKFGSLGC